MANQPNVSFQSKSAPYPVISYINYAQSASGGNYLPVLGGEISNLVYFRVYNNFNQAMSVATMDNVQVTIFDGAGANSHTGTQSPSTQSWVRIYETGFGEKSSSTSTYTQFNGQDTAIGRSGLDYYIPEFASDGSTGDYIRAGTDENGYGFIEFATYVEVPDQIGFDAYALGLSIIYDWTP